MAKSKLCFLKYRYIKLNHIGITPKVQSARSLSSIFHDSALFYLHLQKATVISINEWYCSSIRKYTPVP